jgi:3-oxoacyl-[acyl-carrier protein] reductase
MLRRRPKKIRASVAIHGKLKCWRPGPPNRSRDLVATLARAALRYFRDAPHGAVIVNNAGVLGWRSQHSQSHYAVAKAGVMALTRCSAIEAVEYGVRINAVPPTIAQHEFLDKTTSAELFDRLSADETFGRAAEPWQVAATIALLASDYSSCLTREVILVSSQHP